MNIILTATIILVCLGAAILLGTVVRRRLPANHRDAETKDTVKMAVGLVATMAALLLGLLVSSAKDSYDTVRGEVIEMAAKVTFLDRVLRLYGPETAPIRTQLQTAVEEGTRRMWAPNEDVSITGDQATDGIYFAIQGLSPRDDTQRSLKDQAASLAVELAQLRALVHAQSLNSISWPLLVVLVAWLVVIFFGFAVFSPQNASATLALAISALSVAGAIFLILEMDRPFTGLIQISSEPLVNATSHFSK